MPLDLIDPSDPRLQEALLLAAALLAAGLAAGFAAGWFLRRLTLLPTTSALQAEHAAQTERIRALEAQAAAQDALRTELAGRQAEIAGLEARLDGERRAHAEKLEELADIRRQIEKDLQAMMARMLESGSDRLLKTAQDLLSAQREKGETSLKGLVEPMRQSLERFQAQVVAMETSRKRDEGMLSEHLRQVGETHSRLHMTTTSLVNALRSAPKTRGRWGEQQLRTLLEMAGMAEHVDFETEKHLSTEEGRFRPDVVVRMPGGRTLVVDAKTSLSAYLEAVEADDEDGREQLLKDHARQIRSHAMQLGGKEYWRHLPEESVDFVVMFVPGEPIYSAAMARDPGLFEDAWDRRVIICSPTTLLGLAKAIAYGWRQEKASADAQKVHETGVELYRRMVRLGSAVSEMTRSLDRHVRQHNAFLGTLEGSVLPKARQMSELSIGDAHGNLPDLEPVPTDLREARRDRDLAFD